MQINIYMLRYQHVMRCFSICNQVNYFLDWKNVLCRIKVSFEFKASHALTFPNWANMNTSYIYLINSQFASSAGKLNPVLFASGFITLWRWDFGEHIEKLLKLLRKKDHDWLYDYPVVVLLIFCAYTEIAVETAFLNPVSNHGLIPCIFIWGQNFRCSAVSQFSFSRCHAE